VRRAFARLLGVVLTLALTSVVAMAAFTALSRGATRASVRAPLPLYFNAAPRNVHDLARTAVQRLKLGPDEAAAQELARLGGAALPHVLPYFDALSSSARGRVALALTPVARRMGVAADGELSSAEGAVAFWVRFWQDRSFDFRPQVVRRMVGRLAQKSNALRLEDILHLDTYSLSELIPALGRIRNAEDVRRAERLTAVLAHVTGQGPLVDRQMSVGETRSAVQKWQNFWLADGPDFVTLDGPRRVVAAFAQTRYGTWVLHALGVLRNPAAEAGSPLGIPLRQALATSLRLLAGLGLGLLLGTAWTSAEVASSRRVQGAARVLATLAIALPTPFLVTTLGAPRPLALREAFAALLAATLCAALLSRHALATFRGLGPNIQPGFVTTLATLVAAAPSCLPWLMTAVLGLEIVLDLSGGGPVGLTMLARGDVGAGMSLALGGSLFAVCLVSLAGRAAQHTTRLSLPLPSLVEVGGASTRRLWTVGASTVLLLGLFGAGWSRSTGHEGQGWSAVADGARALLGYGTLTVAVAALAGLALGAAAASGPNSVDGLLVRSLEVCSALPALIWAAALAGSLGSGVALALCLGLLRAIDVAWLLRSELLRRASTDQDLGTRSLGHLPLAIYWRRRLRPSAWPALSAVALTPAWLLALAVAGQVASLRASAGRPGWDVLLARPVDTGFWPSLVAAALLALLTWLLLAAVTATPRRVGAARSTPPPPADGVIDRNP
jgi:ABC-type dipeptide/oligopeptide/nickel transport system permease subunit